MALALWLAAKGFEERRPARAPAFAAELPR
jgi:hypothetical protein